MAAGPLVIIVLVRRTVSRMRPISCLHWPFLSLLPVRSCSLTPSCRLLSHPDMQASSMYRYFCLTLSSLLAPALHSLFGSQSALSHPSPPPPTPTPTNLLLPSQALERFPACRNMLTLATHSSSQQQPSETILFFPRFSFGTIRSRNDSLSLFATLSFGLGLGAWTHHVMNYPSASSIN